jgi:hypothetical protein
LIGLVSPESDETKRYIVSIGREDVASRMRCSIVAKLRPDSPSHLERELLDDYLTQLLELGLAHKDANGMVSIGR